LPFGDAGECLQYCHSLGAKHCAYFFPQEAVQKKNKKNKKKKTCTDRLFPKMGECREVLGGGPAPPSKL